VPDCPGSAHHVVMGTGFYKEGWLPPEIRSLNVDEMTAIMVRELVEGVDGTGVKAGVIGEIGCSRPTRRTEERVLAAAAAAQRATGAVVSVHFDIGGPDDERRHAVDILESEGADLRRVVVEHFTCRPDELELVSELANRGCYIEFDLWGMEAWRDRGSLRMSARGPDRIAPMVHHGGSARSDSDLAGRGKRCERPKIRRIRQSHILRTLVPRFREEGITDADLHAIMVDNPARCSRTRDQPHPRCPRRAPGWWKRQAPLRDGATTQQEGWREGAMTSTTEAATEATGVMAADGRLQPGDLGTVLPPRAPPARRVGPHLHQLLQLDVHGAGSLLLCRRADDR